MPSKWQRRPKYDGVKAGKRSLAGQMLSSANDGFGAVSLVKLPASTTG